MHCALILVTLAILHHLHQYVMQVALWYYLSTNVTLVLIALVLVALTQSHGIMCLCAFVLGALVLVATTAIGVGGLVL